MANSKSNPEQNVHHEPDSRLGRLQDADKELDGRIGGLEKLVGEELRSSKRNFWVAVFSIIGAAVYLENYRQNFNDLKDTVKAGQQTQSQMQNDLRELKETSIVTTISLEHLRDEYSVIPTFEQRIRELERNIDRMKSGQQPN